MEHMKAIKSSLVSIVQNQLSDLKNTDAKELGEVVDMIKDLSEAMYYCSIAEAMEKADKEEKTTEIMRYGEYMPWNKPSYYPPYYLDDDNMMMYYDNSNNSSRSQGQSQNGRNSNGGSTSYYGGPNYYYSEQGGSSNSNSRSNGTDSRSNQSRRNYIEATKHRGSDNESMKELNHYINELGDDLTDMIKDSSLEEKKILSDKLQQLATKIK